MGTSVPPCPKHASAGSTTGGSSVATPRKALSAARRAGMLARGDAAMKASARAVEGATNQGLTLVHFSAQLKRFLWDRGVFRDCLRGVSEVSGALGDVYGVFCVRNGSG